MVEKDIIAGDLDLDGDLDVLIGRKQGDSLDGRHNVLLVNNSGTLVDMTLVFTDFYSVSQRPTRDVKLIDVNLDGWPDVFFVNTGDVISGAAPHQQPRLYRNKGRKPDGSWDGLELVPLDQWLDYYDYPDPGSQSGPPVVRDEFHPAPRSCAAAVGDMVGPNNTAPDGLPDIFLGDYQNTLGHRLLVNLTVPGSSDFRFEDRTDDPLGAFEPLTAPDLDKYFIGQQSTPGNFYASVETLDLGGDGGGLDVIYWPSIVEPVVLTNNGQGKFSSVDEAVAGGTGGAYAGTVIDYNLDGLPDLYTVADGCDGMSTGKNGNPGNTKPPTNGGITEREITSSQGGCPHVADFNRDGSPDLGIAGIDVNQFTDCLGESSPLHLMLNTTPPGADPDDCTLIVYKQQLQGPPPHACGSGTALQTLEPWNVEGVFDMAFLDFNQNGFLDLLFGTCTGLELWVAVPFTSAGTYCTAKPNEQPASEGARLDWSGDLNISSGSTTFELSVTDASPNTTGQFFYGSSQIYQPFSYGIQCVGGAVHRLLPQVSTDSNGAISYTLDWNTIPVGSGPGQIHPGSTWNFQFQYRQPAGGGLPGGVNFSDAISATFAP